MSRPWSKSLARGICARASRPEPSPTPRAGPRRTGCWPSSPYRRIVRWVGGGRR